MEKIRTNGQTIQSDKMYRGDNVLKCIQTSYESGRLRGLKEAEKAISNAYREGFEAGQNSTEAGRKLNELKALLKEILN